MNMNMAVKESKGKRGLPAQQGQGGTRSGQDNAHAALGYTSANNTGKGVAKGKVPPIKAILSIKVRTDRQADRQTGTQACRLHGLQGCLVR